MFATDIDSAYDRQKQSTLGYGNGAADCSYVQRSACGNITETAEPLVWVIS